jgi:hypothetical protein
MMRHNPHCCTSLLGVESVSKSCLKVTACVPPARKIGALPPGKDRLFCRNAAKSYPLDCRTTLFPTGGTPWRCVSQYGRHDHFQADFKTEKTHEHAGSVDITEPAFRFYSPMKNRLDHFHRHTVPS